MDLTVLYVPRSRDNGLKLTLVRSVYDVMDLVDSRLLLEHPFIGNITKVAAIPISDTK